MVRNYTLLLLCLLTIVSTASAGPESRNDYIKHTKESYVPNVKAVQDGKKDIVTDKISDEWNNKDPLFYGGNDLAGIAEAFTTDTERIIYGDFLDCLDLEIVGLCYDDGIPTGFKIEYRWPMQVVHTHNFWQNRYLPTVLYDAFKDTGFLEEMYYPMVNNAIMPLTIGFGGYRAWQDALFHGFPISNVPTLGAGNTDLAAAPEKSRYTGGTLGTAGHLEYSVVPTTAQLAWTVIAQIFPILQYIPCLPPTQIPIPFTSEDPINIELTRNWVLYPMFYKEVDLQKDMNLWVKDPSACVRYNMNRNQGNIPYDMYNPDLSTGSIGSMTHPVLYTPMADNELKDYERMCTKNWGATLPYTTVESVNAHDIVHAGINFEKALRYAWAIYLTFLRENNFPRDENGFKISNPDNWKGQGGAAEFAAYYPLHKTKDRIQYVYHDRAPRECVKVGQPAPKFAGADQLRQPGEAGLYSIVHWKHFRCCAGFF